MQLSSESYRTRWLILVLAWAVAGFAIFQHAVLMRDYLNFAGALGLRGVPGGPTTPLKQVFLSFEVDAQVWVRHALSLLEGHDVQLRYTHIDNAPDGREVHWNSAWAWCIAGAGKVYQMFTGEPIANCVEKATIWLNPCTLLALTIILSAWTTRRMGLIGGVVVVAAMVCHDRLYEGFYPGYVDHHGLLTISVFATTLGAAFMGGGWWRERTDGTPRLLPGSPDQARSGAVFSAIAGACGLWVSAASVIPPIAIVGIAGALAIFVQGRTALKQGAQFDAGAWRLWGRVGAAASIFFYLIEYFPFHLGFRLEPNHPFHAIAWLGGGELVALFGERWLGAPEKRWGNLKQFAWPIAAVMLVPLTVLIGGARVFAVLDPFMSRLHNDYIMEFLPIWQTTRTMTGKMIFQLLIVDSTPLIAAIATLSYKRRESSILLFFTTFVALLLTFMAWGQTRWLLNASGAQVCLALVVITVWTVSSRVWVRWVGAMAFVTIAFLPSGIMRNVGAKIDVEKHQVSPREALGALYRDVAAAIRASQPTGDVIMLSSPNASTGIGYYGRFQTLGTLYWENTAGLKAAASIYSARSEEEAAKLIKQHHVTHIVILSEENFIGPYFQLLNPKAAPDEIKKSFGYRLFVDRVISPWLQMIPYAVPEDMKSLKMTVSIYKVNFQQTIAEAYYWAALTMISQGNLEEAERLLSFLTQNAPQLYQPWLRRADIRMTRHEWSEATEYYLKGTSLAPANERPALYIDAAGKLYAQPAAQQAMAVKIYRAAIAEQRTPDILCYLAWVLATSPDDSVRNGHEALELAEECIKADPSSPRALNTLAAALAENGRFPEAIQACDRAVVNAQVRNDNMAAQVFAQRLAILKTGKPLRN